jgi:hypothetical protein
MWVTAGMIRRFCFADLEDLHHERNITLFFEPLANMLP